MNQKTNLVLQAAVAAAFGLTSISAHAVATASSNPVLIATAALKDDTTTVRGAQVAYSTDVPIAVVSSPFYLYVKLSVGTFGSTPVTTAGLFKSSNVSIQQSLSKGAATLSTDKTFFSVPFNVTAAPAGVNTLITFNPTGVLAGDGEVDNLSGLATGGNVVTSLSIGSAQSLTTPLADIDNSAGGANITFTAAQKMLAYASSSSGFVSSLGGAAKETAVINVATGTGINLTNFAADSNATNLNFGGFYFKDIPGALTADQVDAWTLANIYTASAVGATVTGNFAAAASMFVASSTGAVCSAGMSVGGLVLNTAKTSAAASGLSIQATTPSSPAAFICMTVDGKTVIPSTQPVLTTALKTSSLTYPGNTIGFGPTSLYNLVPNGGLVKVRSYIPVAAGGYTSYIRVINTGSNSASISMAFVNDTTGLTGTAGVIGTAIPPGGAAIYSASQIEAVLGAQAAGARPRVQVTAPTSISVQHYIINPNGTLTTMHSSDDDATQ